MASVANLGRIDLISTIANLQTALQAAANEQSLQMSKLEGLALAQAYRQARDPAWGSREAAPVSGDRGVALARTLGLLAVHHQMAPVLAEVHASRRAAAEAEDALKRLLQANANLEKLGQTFYPLLGASKAGGAALQAIAAARLRMQPSLTDLPEELRNSELLLNATRELSAALRPAEIARLIDDCGGGDSRKKLDRVRRRIRDELPRFAPGYSEGFWVPFSEPEADVSIAD